MDEIVRTLMKANYFLHQICVGFPASDTFCQKFATRCPFYQDLLLQLIQSENVLCLMSLFPC